MQTHDPTQSAFLDIAANLLAVILIVTLFSLVASQHRTHSPSHPDAQPHPNLRFIAPQRDLFPPFSAFFFVVSDRVIQWDQDAVIDTLRADPQSFSGTTPQGRYQWLPEPIIARDIDTFQINFFLDPQAILTQETPFSDEKIEHLMAELMHSYQNERTAPVFIVYPSGMETFVKLHARLQDAGLRFRWFTRKVDEPLFLGRHPAQFTHHAIYW